MTRRRVVYYAILLLLILGELLEERNYIIIIFPEYNNFLLILNTWYIDIYSLVFLMLYQLYHSLLFSTFISSSSLYLTVVT